MHSNHISTVKLVTVTSLHTHPSCPLISLPINWTEFCVQTWQKKKGRTVINSDINYLNNAVGLMIIRPCTCILFSKTISTWRTQSYSIQKEMCARFIVKNKTAQTPSYWHSLDSNDNTIFQILPASMLTHGDLCLPKKTPHGSALCTVTLLFSHQPVPACSLFKSIWEEHINL